MFNVPRPLLALATTMAIVCAFVFAPPSEMVFWSDSVTYFSAAEALLQNASLVSHQNRPLTVFPPIYPLLVSVARGLGADRETTAFLINLVAIVAIAAVVCRVVWTATRSPGAVVAIVLGCLALGPMPIRLRYAASELPFMALMMLAVDQTDRRVWRLGWAHALGLGLVCGLAILTRYSGLVVAATVGLWLLGDVWRVRAQWLRVLWFTAGAGTLTIVWMTRNVMLVGAPLGQRSRTIASLGESLSATASTFTDWIIPRAWWVNTPIEMLVVFGGVLGVFGMAAMATATQRAGSGRTVFVHLSFAVSYIAFIVVSSLLAPIDIINERLLAPAYVPALVAVGIAATIWVWGDDGILRRWGMRSVRVWAAAIGMLVALAFWQARRRPEPEVDFRAEIWRSSVITETARQAIDSSRCFSNEPAPLYLATGHRCVRALTKPYRTSETKSDPLLEWLTTDDSRPAYFVWYYHADAVWASDSPFRPLAGHVMKRIEGPDGEILVLSTRSVPTKRP
jgi:hypothetical protein